MVVLLGRAFLVGHAVPLELPAPEPQQVCQFAAQPTGRDENGRQTFTYDRWCYEL